MNFIYHASLIAAYRAARADNARVLPHVRFPCAGKVMAVLESAGFAAVEAVDLWSRAVRDGVVQHLDVSGTIGADVTSLVRRGVPAVVAKHLIQWAQEDLDA